MKALHFIIVILLIAGCLQKDENQLSEVDIKNEIINAEKRFNEYLLQNGVASAFHHFAAPEAVILRGPNNLIKGPEAIMKFYSDPRYEVAKAYWKPDKVEISKDGTLASTWGKYEWISVDSLGNETKSEGIFHTVWKKMPDGKWKYIWD
ncbi:YybH family protein [Marinigracilibium pacificum]|uniref:DUF4440 domain-containing protein n=1 Tax=Marinigracilibium pacificum TaxID=2729599 RepID=A0A848IZD8_9BACT|nr:DUF4440 domain-containing protein [Marinigracilibium pacificum]NMM47359.1 DUF4440 domain-containing protein [Marinigracilibium pacificum]